jgi:hypothetical protein
MMPKKSVVSRPVNIVASRPALKPVVVPTSLTAQRPNIDAVKAISVSKVNFYFCILFK